LFPFLLALHGGTFLLAALWLGKQHNNWALPACCCAAREGRA
jgi:hypothetical protein